MFKFRSRNPMSGKAETFRNSRKVCFLQRFIGATSSQTPHSALDCRCYGMFGFARASRIQKTKNIRVSSVAEESERRKRLRVHCLLERTTKPTLQLKTDRRPFPSSPNVIIRAFWKLAFLVYLAGYRPTDLGNDHGIRVLPVRNMRRGVRAGFAARPRFQELLRGTSRWDRPRYWFISAGTRDRDIVLGARKSGIFEPLAHSVTSRSRMRYSDRMRD